MNKKNKFMNELLEKLTKDDLVKVIANMHDTIQYWNHGYGFPDEEADTLNKIGSACTSTCVENQDWKLPDVANKD